MFTLQRWLGCLVLLCAALVGLPRAAWAQNAAVTLGVNPTANRKPINPLI